MDRPYTSLRPCPVCTGRSGNVLAHLEYALFDDLNISGTKTLICCDRCTMIYDDVALTEEQLKGYYLQNEHYAASSTGGNGAICTDNNERYDRIIEALKLSKADLILDFGCGQGGFVARCLHRGFKAVGIDPSQKNREVARKGGLVVYGSVDAFVAAEPTADIKAVVFSHVLEHLLDPMGTIRIFAQVAPKTSVYMEVPDADSYLSPASVRWPELYFEHLSHFRRHDLAELSERAGIEILKEETVPFSKDLNDTKCLVLLGRYSGRITQIAAAQKRARDPINPLPFLSVNDLTQDDRPLALWGVSQYAMLLLGSCPELSERVAHLIDSSPAKIGRTINGITVTPPDRLGALSGHANLLIPASHSLRQMLSQLEQSGFNGTVRVIH